jgi:hypothetical protein
MISCTHKSTVPRPSGRGTVAIHRKASSLRVFRIGCLASIVISVVLSVILTVILNLII